MPSGRTKDAQPVAFLHRPVQYDTGHEQDAQARGGGQQRDGFPWGGGHGERDSISLEQLCLPLTYHQRNP